MARKPRPLSRWQIKWMLNLYPPWLFQGIRIVEIDREFTRCTVRVARSLRTRNLNGTTFGGTIFAAADPIYALMFWQLFARRGERLRVWLKSAQIRYLRPARTALTLEFVLPDASLERAAAALDQDGRFTDSYQTEAVDREGQVCAVVDTTVYLRRPERNQPDLSAF